MKNNDFIIGANWNTEQFTKDFGIASLLGDYSYATLGFFAQNDWKISPKVLVEGGLRADFHNQFGHFLLPRIAFLLKLNTYWSVHISSSLGYKTPNVFTQDVELVTNYNNFLPINSSVKSEQSVGINFDMNYHILIADRISLQLNQAFYYTTIDHPIQVVAVGSWYELANGDYKVNTIGTDTYVRLGIGGWALYFGYNHTIAKQKGLGIQVYIPFSPQDKLSSTLSYEIENKWRFGLEQSYIANQYIYADQKVQDYPLFASMIERKFKRISLVLNCENLGDFRQSKSEDLFVGPITNPQFKPLWGPIDGRVINLSVYFAL